MIYLQSQILNCCFTTDAYNEVSFLEHTDFKNYPEHRFRDYYKLLEDCKGDELMMVEAFRKNRVLATEILSKVHVVSAVNLKKYALKLLEYRFEDTLRITLTDLKTDNLAEKSLIQEAIKLIGFEDIFALGDGLLSYLGNLAGEDTINRLNSYINWRDKRINTIKNNTL